MKDDNHLPSTNIGQVILLFAKGKLVVQLIFARTAKGKLVIQPIFARTDIRISTDNSISSAVIGEWLSWLSTPPCGCGGRFDYRILHPMQPM